MHAPRTVLVIDQSPWAVDRLGDVRNVSTAPETNLVAEDPKAASPASADGALCDDAPLLAAPVVNRRRLDDELPLGDLDLQGRVV
jgi:hypothetical protein